MHSGHSLESTKLVIQSHIAAMYLPSLVYAWFYNKLGYRGLLWSGVMVFVTEFIHFWLALILLGIGWNFLFLSGTNLLPFGYRREERFRVQAVNDFLVFSIQAIASLSSGWVMYQWGWNGVLWACVPFILGFAILLWLGKANVGASLRQLLLHCPTTVHPWTYARD
jgi:hypothetical protein